MVGYIRLVVDVSPFYDEGVPESRPTGTWGAALLCGRTYVGWGRSVLADPIPSL